MAKQPFNGLIFSGKEDENYRENFVTYLQNLSTDNLPFNCEHLRVLPQAVKLIHDYKEPSRYEQGSLIYIHRTQFHLNRRCKIESILKLNNDNLEFVCERDGRIKTFRVKLVDFE